MFKHKLSLALVSSNGFAFNVPRYAEFLKVPSNKIFFATSFKCGLRSEQYWFVPDVVTLDYEELVATDHVEVKRWISVYDANSKSGKAEMEFVDNIREFIKYIKNNPHTEGFIIRNTNLKRSKLSLALREIRRAKIENRITEVRKNAYEESYPEFMAVSIEK